MGLSHIESPKLMVFFSEFNYNYLWRVLMWMMMIFDVDRDESFWCLCLYLVLIMCIFALKVFYAINMCFDYWIFDLLFNSSFFRFI